MNMRVRKDEKDSKKKKSPYRNAAEIVIAFLFAWFFYQGLAFALGTPLPVVSVVSDSMFHGTDFERWWLSSNDYYLSKDISKQDFLSFPFANGLSQGDMLVIIKPDDIKLGDVVIYQRGDARYTIIHRVIAVTGEGYFIKGDNNAKEDPGVVKKEQILGKAVIAAPLLGYPRLALFALGV